MKVFCIALTVVTALALAEAKSTGFIKRSTLTRAFAPVFNRLLHDVKSVKRDAHPQDADYSEAADALAEVLGEGSKRSAGFRKRQESADDLLDSFVEGLTEEKRSPVFKKRQEVGGDAAEAAEDIAAGGELEDLTRRSIAAVKKHHFNRRSALKKFFGKTGLGKIAKRTLAASEKSHFNRRSAMENTIGMNILGEFAKRSVAAASTKSHLNRRKATEAVLGLAGLDELINISKRKAIRKSPFKELARKTIARRSLTKLMFPFM